MKGGVKAALDAFVCVRNYRVFWNLWLQIAVEGLHDRCHVLLPCASRHAAKRIAMAAL